jgi:hypothetical protein
MTTFRSKEGSPTEFSDYVVYADESGDHGMVSIDLQYPVFVLVFCIFRKIDYTSDVVPRIQNLKFRFFGHDAIVLHAHGIRKSEGPFVALLDRTRRNDFMAAVNDVIEASPFTVIAAVIDKLKLGTQYAEPASPYNLALLFCLERTFAFLADRGVSAKTTHVVFERRGKREDNDLELHFRRFVQGENYHRCALPLEIVFAHKEINSTGLQLADLVAHPIGRHYLEPSQTNRAYEIIKGKFRSSAGGRSDGWGLKCFP